MSYQTVRYQMSPRQMAHLDIPIGYAFEDTRSRGFITPKTLEKSKGLGMVIGIVAGVMTAGVGWGVMAAAEGIGGMLAGGAMMAGGVMSAVGSATGNKKLSQIGGYLSLAGGGYAALTTAGGSLVGEGSKSLLSAGSEKAMSAVSSAFSSSVAPAADIAPSAAPTVGVDPATATTTSQTIDSTNTAQSIQQGGLGAKTTGISVSGLENAAPQTSTIGLTDKATGLTNPSLGSVSGSNVSLNNAAAGAGAGGGGTSGGLIADAWKSATNLSTGSGMMAGQLLSGLAQGGATEQMAKMQAAQTSLLATKYANDQAELQRQIKNMNNAGAIYYDPNDPNAQKIISAAQAAGIQPLTLSINQNTQLKTPMTAFPGAQA